MKQANIFGTMLTAIAALALAACTANEELDELLNGEAAVTTSRAADNNDQEEPQLVKVTYRKDYYWTPAHDNLMAGYHPIVYRDRTYETGETFTDTFRDYGHIGAFSPSLSWAIAASGGIQTISDGSFVVYFPSTREEIDDDVEFANYYTSGKQGVPDLSRLEYDAAGTHLYIQPGDWSKYVPSHLYDDMVLDVDLTGAEVVGSSGTSNNATGWYMQDCAKAREHVYIYSGTVFGGTGIEIMEHFYDQYLVIDGQIISFATPEFRGKVSYTFNERETTLANGAPAKIIKHEGRTTFYGRDYYASVTDTIYQMSEAEIQAYSAQAAAQALAPANSISPDAPMMTIDDGQPKFIYGGKPKGRKGMF